jgi:hypothetical protein
LIAGKLKRWSLMGRHPSAYPNCSPSRARRNFARLYARHTETARKIGMTALSAYPPL